MSSPKVDVLAASSPFLIEESIEFKRARNYVEGIRDPYLRDYANRYLWHLLSYVKKPSDRGLPESEVRTVERKIVEFIPQTIPEKVTPVTAKALFENTARWWNTLTLRQKRAVFQKIGEAIPGVDRSRYGQPQVRFLYATRLAIVNYYRENVAIPKAEADTIFFNVPEAREHLISKGLVYTLRPKVRKTGKDTAFHGSYYKKEKIADVQVEFVREVTTVFDLKDYVWASGFKNVEDWWEAAEGSRFLFKVTRLPQLPLDSQYSTTVSPRKHWVKIKDPGSSSFTKGAVISYQEFEAERKKIIERGGKLPSIEIPRERPPGNGNGDKHLPATVEAEPIPEKYRELTPFIDLPLPPGTDFLVPAVVPQEGERKIDVVMKQLKDGVEGIQDSAQFRLFLITMAKFHDYSIGNQILIMLQKPEATRVAGFMTWKDLGRWVMKGERGISILAPVMPPKPKKEEREDEEEEIVPSPVYFKVVHVFDLSQTEGKPLPEFDIPVLTGEANEELFSKVLAMAKDQGLDVSFEPRPHMDPSIKGMYSAPKTIWVRPEESKAQQLKSLLHEIAHYYSEGVFRIPRRDAETIAESAAFAVGAHYGFDSGVRSFPYVALWAQDKKTLSQNLNTIRKVADTMLHALEGSLKQSVLTSTVGGYYWTAINKDTGEIVEYDKAYPAPDKALKVGRDWVSRHWKKGDIALVEVWGQPNRYSEKLDIPPTMSETVSLAGTEKEKLLPFAVTKGTCYEDAWRFLIKEEEGELIHGSVQTIGKRINHAWVELPTGYIWEPEAGEFMKKSYFHERAQPQVDARYTPEEAAIMAARTKNFGPWSEQERGKILKRGQPAVIPTKPSPPSPREEMEFVSDSPEYIPFTIEQIGYRQKLDNAFQSRIAQVQGR